MEAGGKCGGEVEAVGEKVAVMASRKRDGVDVGFISTRLLACNSLAFLVCFPFDSLTLVEKPGILVY